MRYYYKHNDGNGYLNLKSPLTDLTGYTEITEEEFNELSKPPEPTEEQKAKIEKDRQIAEQKKKLDNTDYIVLKIAEATFKGDELEVEKLKITYATQLNNRIVWRQKINELEG